MARVHSFVTATALQAAASLWLGFPLIDQTIDRVPTHHRMWVGVKRTPFVSAPTSLWDFLKPVSERGLGFWAYSVRNPRVCFPSPPGHVLQSFGCFFTTDFGDVP